MDNNNTVFSKLIEIQKLIKKESSINELCEINLYNL